jgi:hypothetical protein
MKCAICVPPPSLRERTGEGIDLLALGEFEGGESKESSMEADILIVWEFDFLYNKTDAQARLTV